MVEIEDSIDDYGECEREMSEHLTTDFSISLVDTSALMPPKKKNYQKTGLFSTSLKEE